MSSPLSSVSTHNIRHAHEQAAGESLSIKGALLDVSIIEAFIAKAKSSRIEDRIKITEWISVICNIL